MECWIEADTYRVDRTVYAYATRDCPGRPPQKLSLSLEAHLSNEDGSSFWIAWRTGVGTVSFTCPPNTYWIFRSSRLQSKIVHCTL